MTEKLVLEKLFDDREEKLIKRMEVSALGNKIYITEFGTVYAETLEGKKEQLFDKFIKETEKKIKKEECSIKYDKETNKFYLIEDEPVKYFAKKTAYPIDIKEEYMEDYVFGKYNKITSIIHDLYLKSMTNEERQKMKLEHEKDKKEIITKMNTGHELPTPAEARIYLDYLEEITEENNEDIKSNAKDIAKVTLIPAGVGTLVAGVSSIVVVGETLPELALVGALISYSTMNVMNTARYGKEENYSFFTGIGTIKYIKNRIDKINKKRQDNKLIQTKAEMLIKCLWQNLILLKNLIVQ